MVTLIAVAASYSGWITVSTLAGPGGSVAGCEFDHHQGPDDLPYDFIVATALTAGGLEVDSDERLLWSRPWIGVREVSS